MTREEAIEHLKNMAEHSYPNEEYLMAIEALEQQPCDYYDTYNKTCRRSEVPKEPCEDCISRADVKKYLSAPDKNGDRVIYEDDLDLLPSVQSKPKTDVLDKIKAEIEQMNSIDYVKPVTVEEVLQIIDKYRTESEEV